MVPTELHGSTRFLPAARAPREEILRQHRLLAGDPLIKTLLDSSVGLMLILNPQRQAVFVNKAFRTKLDLPDTADAVGSRIGEYFGCVRASGAPAGCGTTEACRNCGGAIATAGALAGRATGADCRIQTIVCGQDLDLTVMATPFIYKGEAFIMLAATDDHDRQRRRQLEQVFFHDVLNTAGGVQGLLQVMNEPDRPDFVVEKYLPVAERASVTLVDELISQRDIASAENGDLPVTRVEIVTGAFLRDIADRFAAHPLSVGKHIVVSPDAAELILKTDRTLLSRVIVNLIKNALEAEPKGGTVTVSCRKKADHAVFTVHNPTTMSPAVRDQVFQRSFSTKGEGRGLGTYSVRLLTENYLGGRVKFTSDPEDGTTFHAAYPLDPNRT